jgi:VWFA-related protein
MLRFPFRLLHLVSVLIACLFSLSVWAQKTTGGGGTGGTGSTALPPNNAGSVFYGGDIPMGVRTLHAEDEQGKVEFKSETVLLQVPVVVADRSGNHIHNLTKEDFQLFENGKEQKVASFEEVVTSNAKLPARKSSPGEFSNFALNGQPPRSVTVIALDLVNTPFLDQAYGRRQLIRYLADNIESGQTLGLVIIGRKGLKVVQGLTSDPTALIQALKKVSGEVPEMHGVDTDAQVAAVTGDVPAFNPIDFLEGGSAESALHDFVTHGDAQVAQYDQDRVIEVTTRAFLAIAWSLSGVPGRKSLVWATGGFPFYMDSASTVPGGYMTILYERALSVMNDNQISVYPVDVRGLVNYQPTADSSVQMGNGAPATAMLKTSERSLMQSSTIDTLKDFAAMTGGRAFYNTNDLAGSFKRAAEDASSYYLVGYYLDTKNTKPGWRDLKVKMHHRKDLELRARTGFFVTNATVNPEYSRKADLDFAATSPFESTGIPVTMQWLDITAASNAGKKKVEFAVHLPGNGVILEPRINLDFAAYATTAKDGKDAGQTDKTLHGSIPALQLAELRMNGVDYKNELELAPGQYRVRIVVRDNTTGRVGTVSAPLTVN